MAYTDTLTHQSQSRIIKSGKIFPPGIPNVLKSIRKSRGGLLFLYNLKIESMLTEIFTCNSYGDVT